MEAGLRLVLVVVLLVGVVVPSERWSSAVTLCRPVELVSRRVVAGALLYMATITALLWSVVRAARRGASQSMTTGPLGCLLGSVPICPP